jgi:hypothetical protein
LKIYFPKNFSKPKREKKMKNTIAFLTILLLIISGFSACSFKVGNASGQPDSQTKTAEKSDNQSPESSALGRKNNNSPGTKTGSYRFEKGNYSGDLTVEELDNNRLKVNLAVNYEYKVDGEWMANSGTASGVVSLNGNTSALVPEDFKNCEIKMTFIDFNTVNVKQKGTETDCGFGASVYADGTYNRIITDDVPPAKDTNADRNSNSDEAIVEKKGIDVYRVRFKPGKYDGEVWGKIKFKQVITYIIGVKKGQMLNLKLMNLPDDKDISINVVGPGGADLTKGGEFRDGWLGTVPATGDYQIQLSTTEEITDYKLFMVIE